MPRFDLTLAELESYHSGSREPDDFDAFWAEQRRAARELSWPSRSATGGTPAVARDLLSLFDYEARAKQLMTAEIWAYVAGGVMDEQAVRRNREGFSALTLRTQFLRDVGAPELATTVLGCEISLPVLIAPTGVHTVAHPDGELETARGAAMSGTLMIVGLRADHTVEEIAAVTDGPLWFQLTYLGQDVTEALVRRAEDVGCRALVLTVDAVGDARGEETARSGFADALATRGIAHFQPSRAGRPEAPPSPQPVSRQMVRWLRDVSSLPLVLKGITTAEDARTAVDLGADAVIVSNHGGRVLDSVPASIESLAEVAAAVDGRVEVYLDSGIRRGADVLKALALGARAVAIGRPTYWGLAVDGRHGVHGVVEILRDELTSAMQCCGQGSVEAVDGDLVAQHEPFG